jgi:hypothetical protein
MVTPRFSTPAQSPSLQPLQGRVVDVRTEQGEARLSISDKEGLSVGQRGEIQSRSGPVEFTVESIGTAEVRVRERRNGEFEKVRNGDRVILYLTRTNLVTHVEGSLKNLDSLLAPTLEIPKSVLETGPDQLESVTGETLIDYEAWLKQLESEPSAIPAPPSQVAPKKRGKIPFYPDIEIHQEVQSGADFNRSVSDTTSEETIGRFLRWNYFYRNEWWQDNHWSLENDLQQSDQYRYDELDLRKQVVLWNGDERWYRNRTLWKDYSGDNGESFLYDDLEARQIHKISTEWEWQTGVELETRQEYKADINRGYTRFSGISEWNYQKDETWLDIGYALTREIRSATDDADQQYLENLLTLRYSKTIGEWELYLTGREEYRDYEQAENRSDRLESEWFGSLQRKLNEKWTTGIEVNLESDLYRYTEDFDSDNLLLELAPTLDYWGDEYSLSFSPRLTWKHFLGEVPREIPLPEGSPYQKSEGDYFEVGFYSGVTWFPTPEWHISLSNDLAQRWFPAGETGETVGYLDALLLAESINNLASLYIDYRPSKNVEISLYVTHTIEVFSQYSENDFSTFNAGIEASYLF